MQENENQEESYREKMEVKEEELNNEDQPRVDLTKLSNEVLQVGINANLDQMVGAFLKRLRILEELIGRKVDINVNFKLPDGRKVHIKVR